MFKTSRNAELLSGLSTAPDGVQFWSYVELEMTWPWFYLQIVEDDGKEAFQSMLMVPSVPLLEQIIAAQTDHALRISVNVTAHFANNVTGASTRLRGV